MQLRHLFRLVSSCVAASLVLGAFSLSADVIETKDGARIVGKIAKIDAGSIYITTSFAGDIVVKQSEVTAIATDAPVAVRLQSGTRIDGLVETKNGAVEIVGADGTITTSISKIAATWATGDKDPALVALEHHWKYEATVDITGTTGNHNQLGTGATFGAKLVTPQDSLAFATAYNRQVTDGVKSADQFNAGVDYTSNITDRSSWFVRDEGGFDRVMDVKFYDTAAVGEGYDFIKDPTEVLTGRAGLAYRYTGYDQLDTPAVNSAGADFELASDMKTKTWELVDKLTAVPTFNDFKNFIVTQDSYWQIPLLDPSWKLRMGVSNIYNSQPPLGIKKLDTTYYTHLVLDFQ